MRKLQYGRVQADKRHALKMRTRAFLEANVTGSTMRANEQLLVILEVAAASYICHVGWRRAEPLLEALVRRTLSRKLFL